MRIRYSEKNAIGLVVFLLAASIALGFLNMLTLYVLLAFEIIVLSFIFVSKMLGKITLLQLLWIVSTIYIILNIRTLNFYVLFFVLNLVLGLMVLICININTTSIVYGSFKFFVFFGVFSAITTFIEVIWPNSIISIFRALAPNELLNIQIFLRQGRYLGITNYVWYTTMLLFLGGGYLLSEFENYNIKQKTLSIIVILLLVIASFVSGSRSTLIVFPFVAALFYGGKNTIRNIIIAIGALLVLYFVVVYSNLSIRIIKTFQNLIDNFFAGDSLDNTRASFRELAITLFNSHKIFGIGWYEYRYHAFNAFNSYYHVHNLYVQLLCENGIVGTVIIACPWVITYVKAFVYVFKNRKISDLENYKTAKYCLMVLTLIYIDSVVHVTIFDPRTMLIFYIICGITMQCIRVVPKTDPEVVDNLATAEEV